MKLRVTPLASFPDAYYFSFNRSRQTVLFLSCPDTPLLRYWALHKVLENDYSFGAVERIGGKRHLNLHPSQSKAFNMDHGMPSLYGIPLKYISLVTVQIPFNR